MDMTFAMSKTPKRGCGSTREPGGVYLETSFSIVGVPLRYFLIDPPWIPIDENGNLWTPATQGITIAPSPDGSGLYHAWDWIGASIPGYPFFPDFYEEGRRLEFSRRVPRDTQFGLLSRGSWHFLLHPKGMISPWPDDGRLYKKYLPGAGIEVCPTDKHNLDSDEFCTGLLWQLVDSPQPQGDRMHTVFMPRDSKDTFSYLAAAPPLNYQFEWVPAVVLRLPIHRIAVISDPFSSRDDEAFERIVDSGTDIPVEVVPE